MAYLDLPHYQTAQGSIKLPGSKSISNRILLLAALAHGSTRIHDLLDSEDTQVMLAALKSLGVTVTQLNNSNSYDITGCAGRFPNNQADLFMGNAGTAIRPLTAALAIMGGHYSLTGVARMHERPIGDLVDALRQLGARVDYLQTVGYPPLRILPSNIDASQAIKVRGDVSSQFLTALLLALPMVKTPSGMAEIKVVGELISKPYIDITLNLLQRFGITVERSGWSSFKVPNAAYVSPQEIYVEGDASSASYFLAAGALAAQAEHPVRVEGVGRQSIQGDVRFAEMLTLMGAKITMGDNWIEASSPGRGQLQAIDADFNHIPDAAMTIAVLALFANGTSTLRNIASWRVKETDRLAAMAIELRKLGAIVEEGADYLKVTPPLQWSDAAIDTYDDHRMAMCFSLAAFGPAKVRINDPKCVAKTFPDYFAALAQIAR